MSKSNIIAGLGAALALYLGGTAYAEEAPKTPTEQTENRCLIVKQELEDLLNHFGPEEHITPIYTPAGTIKQNVDIICQPLEKKLEEWRQLLRYDMFKEWDEYKKLKKDLEAYKKEFPEYQNISRDVDFSLSVILGLEEKGSPESSFSLESRINHLKLQDQKVGKFKSLFMVKGKLSAYISEQIKNLEEKNLRAVRMAVEKRKDPDFNQGEPEPIKAVIPNEKKLEEKIVERKEELSKYKIFFESESSGLGDKQLYVMNPDGTERMNLTGLVRRDLAERVRKWELSFSNNLLESNTFCIEDPALSPRITLMSPSGNFEGHIAFICGGDVYAYAFDITNSIFSEMLLQCKSRELTNWLATGVSGQAYDPAWSPDGTKLAFSLVTETLSATSKNFNIYVIDRLKKGVALRLIENPAIDRYPAWDPNGEKGKIRLVYASNRTGNFEIYKLVYPTEKSKKLTNNPAEDTQPAYSPDGKKLAFVSDRDGNKNIYIMNADGTNQTKSTDNLADDISPVWSPDGKQIIFTSNRDNETWPPSFLVNWEIYTMNPDGTGQTRLTKSDAINLNPSCSPLYYPKK